MAELAQAAQQVYAAPKTLRVWRALLNWLAFFFQVLLQILKGTPSLAQLLSPSSSASFKPLPVQLPHPDHSPSDPIIAAAATADDDAEAVDGKAINKLTSIKIFWLPPDSVEFNAATALSIIGLLYPSKGMTDVNANMETVVLDLDETLVCAYETTSLPSIVRNQATEAGLKWFELECVSVERDSEGKQRVNLVTVFERPGLHEFLQQLSEFADLVLFTAGLEGYARPLVDRIDIDNRFSLRLYRPATISTKYREHVKDLSCLSNDLGRTVIVDNNPFSFLLQPLNGIPCIPFSAGQPHDEQLIEVLLPLLKHLSLQKDVRPVLYERFHMPEWFERHGIPTSDWTV